MYLYPVRCSHSSSDPSFNTLFQKEVRCFPYQMRCSGHAEDLLVSSLKESSAQAHVMWCGCGADDTQAQVRGHSLSHGSWAAPDQYSVGLAAFPREPGRQGRRSVSWKEQLLTYHFRKRIHKESVAQGREKSGLLKNSY